MSKEILLCLFYTIIYYRSGMLNAESLRLVGGLQMPVSRTSISICRNEYILFHVQTISN